MLYQGVYNKMYNNNKNNKNGAIRGGTKLNTPQKQLRGQNNLQNLHVKQQIVAGAQGPKSKIDVGKKVSTKKQIMVSPVKAKQELDMRESKESSELGSEFEKQELLLMEIKQLKRENQFLRKKILESTSQYEAYYPTKKKTISKGKGSQIQSSVQTLHLSVNYFFKEVGSLLDSVAKLFNLQVKKEEIKIDSSYIPEIECPIQRNFVFKKQVMTKKLERILLQNEEMKYPALLQLFGEYYRCKEQAEEKIVNNLNEMIDKTNSLNKWLLEKAQVKSMKSEVFSINQKDSIFKSEKGFTLQSLKLPENSHNYRFTFSPSTKHTQGEGRKVNLSPV